MTAISLRTRTTLLLATATLTALCIAVWIVDWRADADMQMRFDASLLARAQALAALIHGDDSDAENDAMADRLARFPGVATDDWYVVTCAARTIAQSTPAPPLVADANQPRFFDTQLADGRPVREVALRFQPTPDAKITFFNTHADAPTCVIRYALDRGPLDEILRTLDLTLIGSIFGACALVLLLTPWLVRRSLHPLVSLDRAMADIGPDSPGGRLPENSTLELKPLVTRFNEVLARMDAGLARERQFASGLAHEFRTRLTELRSLVEVETRYPSGRETHFILGEVGGIGAELEATVTALLQLTRIGSGLESDQTEIVSITTVVSRLCARYQAAACARALSINCELDCDKSFVLEAAPALLDIVLDNLLGNAVAYAPAHSRIVVRAQADSIAVRNAAPMLHANDLQHFGERFWRKQAHGAGHAGLGLALATAAASALRMTLTFDLANGQLCASLRWRA